MQIGTVISLLLMKRFKVHHENQLCKNSIFQDKAHTGTDRGKDFQTITVTGSGVIRQTIAVYVIIYAILMLTVT